MSQFDGGNFEQRQSLPAEFGAGNAYNRSSESNSLRALTIRQFKQAVASTDNSQVDGIIVDNQTTNNFCVVGEIMSVRSQATSNVYTINDGTEEMNVMKYKPRDNESIMHQEQEAEEVLEEQTWVMVYGHYKPLNDCAMAVLSARCITDHNEIAYHFAQCIQQHLYYTKGPLHPKPEPNVPAARQSLGAEMSGGSVGRQVYGGGAGQSATQKSGDIFESIKTLLNTYGETHIDEICKRLQDEFGRNTIKDAVKTMSTNGQIYMGSSDDCYVWSG